MNIDEWITRWKEGRLGFHEGRPNAYLERHAARLGSARRVLVPLCGKAEDLAFLAAQGHEVVGIEVAEQAVRAFFAEHDLEPDVRVGPRATTFRAGPITILAGDVFACSNEDVGPVNALYDRAALVALPEDVRVRYVAHLRSLLSAGATGLVVTFEYPQDRLDGPPFSVAEDELRRLYEGAEVQVIDGGPADAPKFSQEGIEVHERCFVVSL